jgi:hypothetical protein
MRKKAAVPAPKSVTEKRIELYVQLKALGMSTSTAKVEAWKKAWQLCYSGELSDKPAAVSYSGSPKITSTATEGTVLACKPEETS